MFFGNPSKEAFYILSAFFIAIISAHFSPLNIFQTWPILKTNYLRDHFSAQFKRHPDQMARSRCTPIKLQISTHRSLSPTQRSLKADLSLCLCHQCSDLENLDQKSENLPCSTTRELMLMVPAKRGKKGLPLKLPGSGIIGLGIDIGRTCENLWSIMR